MVYLYTFLAATFLFYLVVYLLTFLMHINMLQDLVVKIVLQKEGQETPFCGPEVNLLLSYGHNIHETSCCYTNGFNIIHSFFPFSTGYFSSVLN